MGLSLGVAAAWFAGCSGSGEPAGAETVTETASIPVPLLEKSWPVLVADDAVRAPYESNRGWHQVIKRDYRGGVKQLGSLGGLQAARAHAEAAAMYRQAAMVAANALIETYGATPKDSDPVEAAHLLAVSYALNGEIDKAKAESAKLDAHPDHVAAAWHAPWKAWLDAGGAWPPDLAALPIELPQLAAGEWPEPPVGPHYEAPERVVVAEGEPPPTAAKLAVSDPSVLVAVALWHDSVARGAAGAEEPAIVQYGARYRFPVEGAVAPGADLPLDLLFGSDFLVPTDAAFMAAVLGAEGEGAVDAWKEKSAVAALAALARRDGHIDPELAIDLSARLRQYLLEAQGKGTVQGFHRTFADTAEVGLLRQLALIAEIEGNRETSGKLRITAMEHSTDETTACPNALLSLAAWDAANRYPLRPSDMLHNLIRRYPSLETARFALDALSLRVSRELPSGGVSN